MLARVADHFCLKNQWKINIFGSNMSLRVAGVSRPGWGARGPGWLAWLGCQEAWVAGLSDRPDIRPDVRPDIWPDVRPDIRLDVRPDVRQDIWPDVRPDVQPDVRPDIRPDQMSGRMSGRMLSMDIIHG